MTIYIILLFFSGTLSLAIIAKNFLKVFHLSKNGENLNLAHHHSLFEKADEYLVIPIKTIFENRFLPFFYKEIEKIGRLSRIYILKIENKLFKFNNYIKGKRILKDNGNTSEYMQKLNGFKKREEQPAKELC